MLTNFTTIKASIDRLKKIEAMATDGRYDTLSKKEIAKNDKERRKLLKNLEGIRGMSRLPDAVFIVDTKKEKIAVDEARKLGLPVLASYHTLFEEYLHHYAPWLPGGWLRGGARLLSRRQCNALDGIVVSGQSGVNQAPITGESIPVEKTVGAT